ncbi:DNA segregation ATPase FtsK [Mycobacteroides abscessus]|uniref:DNA segregation ATPase FtsK n=3 Tax=Mycobacteriaceae TaxID=1762 RepID=W9ASH1_MYCCO|nr:MULTISPECIES: FtsK/SpoIIIE domain-containing protein [Mycobacteriaceae]ESV59911.1 ftsK/SpoIIIE family protein [Mycobacteroides abscessus MAB_082312_2258]ESV63204.1 ftsK/SpoIIIE family protein [Mycobacteroides abscessus MAB_091912_2446]HNI66669.1 FtsK/SpoIIIE domain-containing protein [Nitrospira sp.]AMU28786.1 cell division protein FtsK [Mycobacteroides abscessus]AMU43455.1 cell division protein FtsK [Mycobacteroides abscessus]
MASNNKSTNNTQSNNDDWIEDLIVSLFKAVGYLLWWAILFPAISIPIVACIAVAITHGVRPGLITAVVVSFGYMAWAWLDRRSFHAWVTEPVRRRWLTWWRYTRNWGSVCVLHGLTAKLGERILTPTLQSVQIGTHTDVLRLRVVTGQSVPDWHRQAEALAATWRAERVTITATAPGELRITLMRGDLLAEPIALPMPTPATIVDLTAVCVGMTESHGWWRLPLLGHHILVAGATGAGKGSVLWSLVTGIAPSVKTGHVRLCVIDPKGGMELGAGAPMFTVFSHDATDTTLHLLRQLVEVMHARANRLRGKTRLHTPTSSEPLFVVVIDEIAALTAYVTDRKLRSEIEQLLGLLLSQGRAVGISVVAAVQDPAKDTLPVRQLFTVRIGLRLTEATQTAMVLGQGARDAGAECDRISDATPGVGYMLVDGTAQPQRVRAFHVTDQDIATLAARFRRPTGRPGSKRQPRSHGGGQTSGEGSNE